MELHGDKINADILMEITADVFSCASSKLPLMTAKLKVHLTKVKNTHRVLLFLHGDLGC